jgi:hypothetical protein
MIRRKNMKQLPRFACMVLACLAVACGGDEAASSSPTTSGLPERFLLPAVPAGAQDVGTVWKDAQAGEEVVVRGVVGGSAKPFVEGLAAFTLVDPALKSCVGDGMGCKTPWDYCCIDPQTIAKSSVTVEFREAGRPLAASPRGFHGLDHLKTVVVRGVAERDAQGNVTIVASGVRVL